MTNVSMQKAAVKLVSVDNWEDLETAACDAVRWTVSHVVSRVCITLLDQG